jgi:uncharacterized coiled-coil protein SlyX
MTEDESGVFDARRLRKDKGTWLLPILITIVGGVFTYGITSGQNNQRMTELERRSQEQATAAQALATQVANHEVKIAVFNEKLDTILRELGDANAKLDRVEQQRKP